MRKILLWILFVNLLLAALPEQDIFTHGRLTVSPGGHFLQFEDGTPFFWLGDTGWELFHRLNLTEVNSYLENRKEKGFNVIQAVILPEMDGLRKPNRYGEVPLINLDPTTPNEKYFQLVDSVINLAMTKNIFMGLLPTWGDKVTKLWGVGPVIFNPENAYRYGLWLGKRYKDRPNIIWILGGDRPAKNDSVDWRPVWRAMANGILDGTQHKVLITYHPWGGENSTSQYIHNEEWLSVNMIQSGHGGGHDVSVWNWITRDRNLVPIKPVLDAEPNYEDHPVNPWPVWDPANGYYRDYDVRKQTYRSVLAGACGVTYGHHSIWQFWSPREKIINHADRYWMESLDRPGAYQVGYLRRLIESRFPLQRIPDQELIADGQGEKGEYIVACRDEMNRCILVYLPVGKTIAVKTGKMACDKVACWWYNPRNGQAEKTGLLDRIDTMMFTPPTVGIKNDWVLVIDNPEYNLDVPGIYK